ncbi:septal ring lytic transglycosylase RlpA family protein [Anabaena sp. FACHB-1237]|uniref:septal ring lytic transglycosylase RlpA family protein n=1 Tax=Anabaena sp. FACHB-1237 TaxID=2692769 RepID=UPI0016813C9D|nr:septal ring lytic transglycosylase RlpA family protein [Anabaena sp. FACHB-1237]MBD2137393.1 septal ring lytic transglycosylase RlpA family protein [Anabaena sp. FACHB-1237]
MIFTELWIICWYNHLLSQENKPSQSLTVKLSPKEFKSNFTNLVKVNKQGLFIPQTTTHRLINTISFDNFWNLNYQNQIAPENASLSSAKVTPKLRMQENRLCKNVPQNIVSQADDQNTHLMGLVNFSTAKLVKLDVSPVNIQRSLENFFNVIHNPIERTDSYNYQPVLIVKDDKNTYQIWVKNTFVATIPDYITAKYLKNKLEKLVGIPDLYTEEIKPGLVNNIPSILIGTRLLFAIEPQISNQLHRNGDILAIEWTNNLRVALNTKPLSLVEGQIAMYGLTPSSTKFRGLASWYGAKFDGKITANGEIYDQDQLTVAHRSLPFNTYLKVTNLNSGKSVIVRVNDRGPYISTRTLDLSNKAAKCINSKNAGVVSYEAVILRPDGQKITFKPFTLEDEDMANDVF